MRGDPPLQAERSAVGRQQQLDRCRREADAVVQPPDAVLRVDALDREHAHEDVQFREARRIARKQRLDIEGFRGGRDEIHLVAGDVDARHGIDDLVHLGDDDALVERRSIWLFALLIGFVGAGWFAYGMFVG